jgi:hypothetical protein
MEIVTIIKDNLEENDNVQFIIYLRCLIFPKMSSLLELSKELI